jgi:hypothetical protein
MLDNKIEAVCENLDSKSTDALYVAMTAILLARQKFNEATTGSMLSDGVQRQRKTMLTASLGAYLVTWGGVLPTKISWLGIELTSANQSMIYLGVSSVLAYLFRAFWWRADLEFGNSRLKRRIASLLYRFETMAAISKLRERSSELADLVGEDFKSELEADDESDPYRASIMGLNFKSRLFELRLPQIIIVGAMLSCLYFSIKDLVI